MRGNTDTVRRCGGRACRRIALATLALAAAGSAPGAPPAPKAVLPAELHWTSPPGAPGVAGAWVTGSESGNEPYLLRVRITQGSRIPPHVHPDDRHTTVLKGTLYVGFGATFDADAVVAVPAGAVYRAPRGVAHYVWARDGDVEYQESGVGPTGTKFL